MNCTKEKIPFKENYLLCVAIAEFYIGIFKANTYPCNATKVHMLILLLNPPPIQNILHWG